MEASFILFVYVKATNIFSNETVSIQNRIKLDSRHRIWRGLLDE